MASVKRHVSCIVLLRQKLPETGRDCGGIVVCASRKLAAKSQASSRRLDHKRFPDKFKGCGFALVLAPAKSVGIVIHQRDLASPARFSSAPLAFRMPVDLDALYWMPASLRSMIGAVVSEGDERYGTDVMVCRRKADRQGGRESGRSVLRSR